MRWLFWIGAAALVIAQPWLAPGWDRHLGDALREMAVLSVVFGVLERFWEHRPDGVVPLGRTRATSILLMGLAMFAAGNTMDACVERRGHVTAHEPPTHD